MNQQLIYTVGCPGSGKSTWCKQFLQEHAQDDIKWQRVCRDDIRTMCRNNDFDIDNEHFITQIEQQMVRTALEEGYNVLIDATHIDVRNRNAWHRLAQDLGGITVTEQCFDVPLEECLLRNEQRIRHVPEDVIRKMYARLLRAGFRHNYVVNYPEHVCEVQEHKKDLLSMIIVDLDGTIADNSCRNVHDAVGCESDPPIQQVVDFVKKFHRSCECGIMFLTARPERYRESTMKWLLRHVMSQEEFDYDCTLIMRPNDDNRSAQLVKADLFEKHIKNRYHIVCALEDTPRVCRMWKRLGILVFQLNDKEI